jgi:four helix bundle protein
MRDFRSLQVWHKSHQLTLDIYIATRSFPSDERFGLTSQIRRATFSIPANIAEGCGRNTEPELARFMQISMGSASELEYFLLLSHDLALLDSPTYYQLHHQIVEIKRMLAPFINKLKGKQNDENAQS